MCEMTLKVKHGTKGHLVKQLFPCGVILNGKLQLSIHGGHANIYLEGQKTVATLLHFLD